MSLNSKVAIVTGSGRGIGAATALLLAERGARVAIVSRTRAELDQVVARAKELEPSRDLLAIQADISDEGSVRALFEAVRAQLGPCQVLVNNAAVYAKGDIVDFAAHDWDHVMAVNVRGPFLCTREAMRQMKEQDQGGAIINLSSLGGIQSTEKFPGSGAYVASKAAMVGFTEVAAVEGKPHRIRVNCVAPGAVETVMLRTAAPFLKTETRPEDVARVIAYLADEAQSGALSGSVIEIHSNA
jgi:NAD(P)-dependent dehydrogenase (short-subunit alcohol dehydrogenase family)